MARFAQPDGLISPGSIWSAAMLSLAFCFRDAGADSLTIRSRSNSAKAPKMFIRNSFHWRPGVRIDILAGHDKSDACGVERLDVLNEVLQRAPESIELPDQYDVELFRRASCRRRSRTGAFAASLSGCGFDVLSARPARPLDVSAGSVS